MIEAVIFDMDGLLIDSEPLWRKAEVEIFTKVGVPLTEDMCEQTTGTPIYDVVQYWYKRYPWKEKSKKDVTNEIVIRVKELIESNLIIKPGVIQVIKLLKSKNIPLAVCSSSPQILIDSVIQKMGLRSSFEFLYSGENETYGKPHPGAYLTCANKLGITTENILVFEDSLMGAISAKAASMKVIAIPEDQNKPGFEFCNKKLKSMKDFSLTMAEELS